jgi:hypothetical protein
MECLGGELGTYLFDKFLYGAFAKAGGYSTFGAGVCPGLQAKGFARASAGAEGH